MPDPNITPKPAQTQGRPFPWFCANCRRRKVRLATIPYECRRILDGKLITVVIPALDVPKCDNCGELDFADETEEQINRAFQAQISVQQNGQHSGSPIPANVGPK